MVYTGLWGSWKPWVYRNSKLVTGARVRYEDPIGGGDDTVLNAIIIDVMDQSLAKLSLSAKPSDNSVVLTAKSSVMATSKPFISNAIEKIFNKALSSKDFFSEAI